MSHHPPSHERKVIIDPPGLPLILILFGSGLILTGLIWLQILGVFLIVVAIAFPFIPPFTPSFFWINATVTSMRKSIYTSLLESELLGVEGKSRQARETIARLAQRLFRLIEELREMYPEQEGYVYSSFRREYVHIFLAEIELLKTQGNFTQAQETVYILGQTLELLISENPTESPEEAAYRAETPHSQYQFRVLTEIDRIIAEGELDVAQEKASAMAQALTDSISDAASQKPQSSRTSQSRNL